MAQQNQNVCSINKYGFCKFREACRKHHIMEICQKQDCEIQKCSSRHPRTCRYYRDIGYCKFGKWCLFKHNEISNNVKEIQQITDKLKSIEKKIEEKDESIDTLEKVIEEIKANQTDELVKSVDSKIEHFKTILIQ